MVQHLQNLQLAILVALVLEDLLDRHCFARLRNRRFEDHSKGAVADYLLSVVREALLLQNANSIGESLNLYRM